MSVVVSRSSAGEASTSDVQFPPEASTWCFLFEVDRCGFSCRGDSWLTESRSEGADHLQLSKRFRVYGCVQCQLRLERRHKFRGRSAERVSNDACARGPD